MVKSSLLNAILGPELAGNKQDEEGNFSMETKLAGPLANVSCYSNRIKKQLTGGVNFRTRILVIKLGEDVTSQHLNLMSAFFAAQKQGIMIDGLTLGYKSAILQQASDITGGVCIDSQDFKGLLQYLLTVFLPSVEDRNTMALPSSGDVDYRPSCFCHQELLSLGWVCSVCLSVFCKFTPICPTCQTAFKFLPPIPKLKKRKKTTK